MPAYSYERLSAQDNAFLLWETPNLHMHVSTVQTYAAGPLRQSDGGIDFNALRDGIAAALPRIPRYRQRLQWIPFERHAVWVDDPHFDLAYHVRHTALPKPGSETQLKALAARVMAQQLDRNRPLWEIWVVEGLDGDRFALISKIHHCMIDGSSGVGIADILMSSDPDHRPEAPPRYLPRPVPSARELLADALKRRLQLPLLALRGLQALRREGEELREELGARLRAIALAAGWGAHPPSATPINREVGPHRKVDWIQFSLADVRAVRKALGCTVNDVVLATVTGALREFLSRRQVRATDIDFRASAPVSVRSADERDQLGNRVSSWVVKLPIHESEPLRQLEAIHELTRELKESRQALGIETINAIAEWTTSSLLSLGAQASSRAANTIVTNVPGPQQPLYLLGAEMLSMAPMVPLLEEMGLGIALISYNGKLCWGFNADPDQLPDLADFAALVRESFRRLARAAGVAVGDERVVNLDPQAKPERRRRSDTRAERERAAIAARS
jgi:WS/DGAT/MGAT family acyltransferase